MSPDLSIMIINWNTRELLLKCLQSITRHASPKKLEVLVVDNGSTDGSTEAVRKSFSQVRLIKNEENLGFARAANQGIKNSSARHILLLNSDTEVYEGTLERVIDFLDREEKVGAVGLKIVNPDGSLQHSCRRFPSFITATAHAFLGPVMPNNPFSQEYKLARWDHRQVEEVDWVSGAAMGLRRQALDEVGLFDERFYMYLEDMDLCERLKERGWQVKYLPDAVVLHHIAGSSQRRSVRMTIEHQKSIYRFLHKRYRGTWRALLLPLIYGGLIVRGAIVITLERIKRES
ncbi:MAG: N-acetylglucosaminyl-diphospho-decaprenol L-rhamnosyltransferase [Actinobacteria bacterium]|nr:N-acetylglucosaminyl-diphospho-decaprenol L-rhamnosyltransferase [Actinomycetota bacterium]